MSLTESECKLGVLLRAKWQFTNEYVFRFKSEVERINYNRDRVELRTTCAQGDFLIWLQEDQLQEDQTMSDYCFCLHNRTGRILCVSIYDLEIVDLEEVKEESDPV